MGRLSTDGYYKKTVEFSNGMREITKCKMPTLGGTGKREPKSAPTTEKQEKKNLRRCAERLHHLLLENFHPGDYNIALTYRKGSGITVDRAKEIALRFVKLYKAYCKEKGYKPDYIYNTEIKPGIHHHFILHNHGDIEKIEDLWSEAGGGTVQYRQDSKLWANYDWYDLAWYFVDRTKKGRYPDTHVKGERRYNCSHGLRKPKTTYEHIQSGRWYAPRAPKGWYIVADSIRDGRDELTGGMFQKFLLRRLI